MYLTKEEERILDGEEGEAKRIALEILVKVGEALGAEKLINISHAHASGISYRNIGDAGLDFIEKLYLNGGRTSVFSTYNPVGTPLGLNDVPKELLQDYDKQLKIMNYLHGMGFKFTATCLPYEVRAPKLEEHLAWGESSAILVANSLYGARTNREGGPLALAAAITGKTYYWGQHTPEGRLLRLVIKAPKPRDEVEYGVLGYIIGLTGETNVYIDLGKGHHRRDLISLCAAAGASGSTTFIYINGVTPGKPQMEKNVERIILDYKDYKTVLDRLSNIDVEDAEVAYIGCPHLNEMSLNRILCYLVGRKPRKPLYIGVPGYLMKKYHNLAKRLAKRNIMLVMGSCIVVSWIDKIYKNVLTNSVKAAHYLLKRGVNVALTSLENILKYLLR